MSYRASSSDSVAGRMNSASLPAVSSAGWPPSVSVQTSIAGLSPTGGS
jgi:hypothetical protein